ncbi:MAG: DinB family protein [Pyrinomonadaceae bacterium]
MLTEILTELYERDLNKLKEEIELYADEADLWKTGGDIINPAGNLCLHLTGNLQHFFGAVLGGTDYVRDRDAEFSRKDVAKSELLADIDEAKNVVLATLEKLTEDDLAKPYPIEVFGGAMTTGFFLTHLATHLNWHLGHINYHRRLLAS